MKTMRENSIDSIVTDPPAGIAFMGKDWDKDKGGRDKWIEWMTGVASECLRVLKPGGHALVWSIPRTSHWTATAWEDAGFEVRDRIAHIFGSGFPKSMNVSKQIDKMAGAERKVVGQREDILKKQAADIRNGHRKILDSYNAGAPERNNGFVTISADITAPATPEAQQWDGWGTSLKPSIEDWWLFRKPISEKTIAANVLKWGTGAINIDECRVPIESDLDYAGLVNNYKGGLERATDETKENWSLHGGGWKLGVGIKIPEKSTGRWPAQIIHDGSEEVVELFPNSVGGSFPKNNKTGFGETYRGETTRKGLSQEEIKMDSGSAARFFYCAKPSRKERSNGLNSIEIISIEFFTRGGSNWENVGQKVTLMVDTEQLAKRVIAVSGAQNNNALEWNTMLFGKNTTEQSLMDIVYTTRMKTNSIIKSKILNLYQPLTINESMEDVKLEMGNGGNLAVTAGLGIQYLITTSEKMALALGVENVVLPILLKISASEGKSTHPTVKPLSLMRYLITLITPPEGTILDPFLGSGTTLVAAKELGFSGRGIENDPEYLQIAKKRIENAKYFMEK
jgi:DNA modification methylase